MTDFKYHTIDPLILQTLNLNEKRMNYILDILHGRPTNPTNSTIKTQRKHYNRSLLKDTSQPKQLDKLDDTLPPILLNKKDRISTPQKQKPKTYRAIDKSKPKQTAMHTLSHSNNSISLLKDMNNPKVAELASNIIHKSISKRQQSLKKRSATLEEVSFEQDIRRMQQQKKEQLMNDYMMQKLKKSKSVINTKDIYRFEIEALVGELTAIEELQEAEKKMQRLKRRNKHLLCFDKNYYMKLNEHDMMALQ